jgi:kynurenine formamidase
MKSLRIVDLSYDVEQTMMVYPGLSRPVLQWLATYNQEGHWSSKLTLPVHAGTHVDAPKHFVANGQSVDKIPLDSLVGEAVVCNLTDLNLKIITSKDLEKYDQIIISNRIVILNTGTYKKYQSRGFLEYPYLAPDAAQWLVTKAIRALGVDMMSIDPLGSQEATAHRILLGANIPIIENLTNLDFLPDMQPFTFIALPLKIKDGEAAPCRAIALLPTDPVKGE